MKKSSLAIIILMGVVLSFYSGNLWAANGSHNSQNIPFTNTTDKPTGSIPKCPAFIPISGWYDAHSETIDIRFLQDMGDVTIDVQGTVYNVTATTTTPVSLQCPAVNPTPYTITIRCISATYVGYIF